MIVGKLLVKLIGLLITNAGVAAPMVVIVKIVGDTGLSIGQAGEDEPLPGFEILGFEARPQAFGLGIVVALASLAVRELGLDGAQQGFVGVAHVLPAPIRMDDEARGRSLGQ